MIKGDEKYNKHFYQMVTDGLCCGLDHPVEWMIDYGRSLAMPYDQIPEMNEFLGIVKFDLYEIMMHKKTDDPKVIQAWADSHYNK